MKKNLGQQLLTVLFFKFYVSMFFYFILHFYQSSSDTSVSTSSDWTGGS